MHQAFRACISGVHTVKGARPSAKLQSCALGPCILGAMLPGIAPTTLGPKRSWVDVGEGGKQLECKA